MDIDADEHPGDSHARLKTEMWVEKEDSLLVGHDFAVIALRGVD